MSEVPGFPQAGAWADPPEKPGTGCDRESDRTGVGTPAGQALVGPPDGRCSGEKALRGRFAGRPPAQDSRNFRLQGTPKPA